MYPQTKKAEGMIDPSLAPSWGWHNVIGRPRQDCAWNVRGTALQDKDPVWAYRGITLHHTCEEKKQDKILEGMLYDFYD